MVALGPRARWLCDPHPTTTPTAPRSPFARLVEADGQVLMLGAPLETITLLHHAEAIADVPDKRMVTYRIVLASGEEREYTDIETSEGAFDYAALELGRRQLRGDRRARPWPRGSGRATACRICSRRRSCCASGSRGWRSASR